MLHQNGPLYNPIITIMNNHHLYAWLAYLGAIPFVLCALLITKNHLHIYSVFSTFDVINSYALVITVFMAGIYWGIFLGSEKTGLRALLPGSNIITVLVWLAYLFLNSPYILLVYFIAFMLLVLIDFRLLKTGIITAYYFKLRCGVTAVVLSSLLLTFISLIQ